MNAVIFEGSPSSFLIYDALRMQVEVMKRGERGTALHSGLRRSILLIYRQHGLAGLYTPGLTATMIREMFNCSARTGLYAPVRNLIAKNSEGGEATLSTRITSAFATGNVCPGVDLLALKTVLGVLPPSSLLSSHKIRLFAFF